MHGRFPLEIEKFDSTENLIASLHASRKLRSLIINPDYLDDENLPEDERRAVLNEIFNRNIRQRQLERIVAHLTPILDNDQPPAALIYGPTGSGKTVTLIHVLSVFQQVAHQRGTRFRYAYVDLTSPKTHFAALNEVAIALDGASRRYRKGIPVDYMQESIAKAIEDYEGFLCLLIDEADNVRPSSDALLTFLGKTLPRRIKARIILIMLTNRLDWEKDLDPRILSFLKKTDIIFEPYNAMDLIALLELRTEKALDGEKVDPGAIRKIAAYASKETGDARKAVELLAKAARIAEESSGKLTEEEVDLAKERIEVDKTEEMIRALAAHQRTALIACYTQLTRAPKTYTGKAYDAYRRRCQQDRMNPLSQRRFSDIISFLDLYGLINVQFVSKGRYGQTRDISASLPETTIRNLLSDNWPDS